MICVKIAPFQQPIFRLPRNNGHALHSISLLYNFLDCPPTALALAVKAITIIVITVLLVGDCTVC